MSSTTQTAPSAPENAYDEVMDRAAQLLTTKARSEQQLRKRLEADGFEPGLVGTVLGRLKELGILDDRAFAEAWVRSRRRKTFTAPAVLVEGLVERGVERFLAEAVVAAAAPDEEAEAKQAALSLHRRFAALPLDRQAGKLQGALARRGFSEEAVESALRSVLPPEGWD